MLESADLGDTITANAGRARDTDDAATLSDTLTAETVSQAPAQS